MTGKHAAPRLGSPVPKRFILRSASIVKECGGWFGEGSERHVRFNGYVARHQISRFVRLMEGLFSRYYKGVIHDQLLPEARDGEEKGQ